MQLQRRQSRPLLHERAHAFVEGLLPSAHDRRVLVGHEVWTPQRLLTVRLDFRAMHSVGSRRTYTWGNECSCGERRPMFPSGPSHVGAGHSCRTGHVIRGQQRDLSEGESKRLRQQSAHHKIRLQIAISKHGGTLRHLQRRAGLCQYLLKHMIPPTFQSGNLFPSC